MTHDQGASPFDVMLASYRAWADPVSTAFALAALDRASLAPGSRVLDVACGTGALAVPAAQRGLVASGIDVAEGMVEVARQRLAEHPSSGATVMDALELEYPDASFDAAFSVLGVFFFGDAVQRGLSEMRRVVRPGGIVAAVHWADPMGGPMFTVLARAVASLNEPDLPDIGPWGFEYLGQAALRNALQAAGVGTMQTTPLAVPCPLPEPEAMLDEMHTMYLNHPNYVDLTGPRRQALQHALARETEAVTAPGRGPVLARAHLVWGVRFGGDD